MVELADFIYTLLTTDAEMRRIVAMRNGEFTEDEEDVQLCYGVAHPDAQHPYIVYYDRVNDEDSWITVQGTYIFDIVDYEDNAGRAFLLRDRIVALLQRNFYSAVQGHIGVRFWKEGEVNLSENDRNIWRRILTFGFRDIPKRDINEVLSRQT